MHAAREGLQAHSFSEEDISSFLLYYQDVTPAARAPVLGAALARGPKDGNLTVLTQHLRAELDQSLPKMAAQDIERARIREELQVSQLLSLIHI